MLGRGEAAYGGDGVATAGALGYRGESGGVNGCGCAAGYGVAAVCGVVRGVYGSGAVDADFQVGRRGELDI